MLAGLPFRQSDGTPNEEHVFLHDGYIKLRLGHGHRGTVIVPDMIFVKTGSWQFFQPVFFGPCIIGFNVEDDLHIASFSVDICSPRSKNMTRLNVKIRSDAHIKAYPDGSQLYSCKLESSLLLAPFSSGRCDRMDNDDFSLRLFHHTNKKAYSSICSTQILWSSKWNLQGTRHLLNVSYVYFTSLRKIKTSQDLHLIAMATDGIIKFQTTSSRMMEETLTLQVYRESTKSRTKRVCVNVPSVFIAPPHLYFHQFVSPNPAYYEIVSPAIYRVGLKSEAKLPIPRSNAHPDDCDLKKFEYIVLGDTSKISGLAAPYDEEETKEIMHLELLKNNTDLFSFWQKNANTDQMTGRIFEPKCLE